MRSFCHEIIDESIDSKVLFGDLFVTPCFRKYLRALGFDRQTIQCISIEDIRLLRNSFESQRRFAYNAIFGISFI